MTDQLDRDLATLDLAEARLVARATARNTSRERRLRRRALMRRLASAAVLVPALALAGTVALVGVLTVSGGDLSGWPRPFALAALLAAFAVPAGVAYRLWKPDGSVTAGSVACATFGVQLTLTFGGAFVLLGLGPD